MIHIYQKRRLKRLAPLLTGCLLALLVMLKPILILFIFTIAVIFLKKSLKENKPLILFLTGFLIIYLPFVYIEKISVNDFTLITYNLLKNEAIDTNLDSSKSLEKVEIINNFEEKNDLTLEKNGETATLTITDKEFREGKKAAQLEIKTPTKNTINLQKNIQPSNWNEYNYLNIWIKNQGELNWFGIILTDEDGDWWHYDNDQILKKQEWTLLKAPITSFKNYEWTQHGNRKMDKITEYKLKFEAYPEKSDYKAFIDDIYLSKF